MMNNIPKIPEQPIHCARCSEHADGLLDLLEVASSDGAGPAGPVVQHLVHPLRLLPQRADPLPDRPDRVLVSRRTTQHTTHNTTHTQMKTLTHIQLCWRTVGASQTYHEMRGERSLELGHVGLRVLLAQRLQRPVRERRKDPKQIGQFFSQHEVNHVIAQAQEDDESVPGRFSGS